MAADPADPRFQKLLADFARDPELAPLVDELGNRKPGKSFGAGALKVNGKIFAMVVRGQLVVKLARQRVDELVEAGKGVYFDPGHGRLMKQWVSITAKRADWNALAREAHEFVKSQG